MTEVLPTQGGQPDGLYADRSPLEANGSIRPYVAALAEGRHPEANGTNGDENPNGQNVQEPGSGGQCLADLMAAQRAAEEQLADDRIRRLAASLRAIGQKRALEEAAAPGRTEQDRGTQTHNDRYERQQMMDWILGVAPGDRSVRTDDSRGLLGIFDQMREKLKIDPDESDTAARVTIGEIAEAGRTLRITGEQQQVSALPSSPWFWPRRWFRNRPGGSNGAPLAQPAIEAPAPHNGRTGHANGAAAATARPALETPDSRRQSEDPSSRNSANGKPPARPRHSMDGPTMLVQQVTRPNPALTGETVVIPTVPAAATAPNATPAAPEAPIQKPAAQPEATTPQAFTIPGVEGFSATDVIYIGGRPVTQGHLQFLLVNTAYQQLLARLQEHRVLPADREHERPGLVSRIQMAVQQLHGLMCQAEADPNSLMRRPVVDLMVQKAQDRRGLRPGQRPEGTPIVRPDDPGVTNADVDEALEQIIGGLNRL